METTFFLMMSWKLPEKTDLTKSRIIAEVSSLACHIAVGNDMNDCGFIGHHLSIEKILKFL